MRGSPPSRHRRFRIFIHRISCNRGLTFARTENAGVGGQSGVIACIHMNRRQALRGLFSTFGSAAFLGAQEQDDPLYAPVRVMDFAPLAKAKLDPVAWDYLDGGSEDEVSLEDNRKAFNKIILRPRAL